jgi:hypothetical protein
MASEDFRTFLKSFTDPPSIIEMQAQLERERLNPQKKKQREDQNVISMNWGGDTETIRIPPHESREEVQSETKDYNHFFGQKSNPNYSEFFGTKDSRDRTDSLKSSTSSISTLKLSPTPISDFPKDEIILYLKDRLYYLSALELAGLSDKGISELNLGGITFVGGKKYNLPDSSLDDVSIINTESGSFLVLGSEFFLDLEMDYLRRNEGNIESLRKAYINELAKEDEAVRSKFSSLEKSLMENDSLDSLVRNYFFPMTQGVDIGKIISENKTKEILEKKVDISKIRNVKFDHKVSYFSKIIATDMPLLITDGKIFALSSEMEVLWDIASFEKKYKKLILKDIEERTKKNVDSYFSDSFSLRDLENLRDRISYMTSEPKEGFEAERKVDGSEYILIKNIGRYGVKWKGSFYLFPSLKIGISLAKDGNGFRISDRAFAYKNPEYKHPFIEIGEESERRGICTANKSKTIRDFIGMSTDSSTNKAYLMRSAIGLLMEFEGIIKEGFNSLHLPYDSIFDSATPLTESQAESYKRRGVLFFPKTIASTEEENGESRRRRQKSND